MWECFYFENYGHQMFDSRWRIQETNELFSNSLISTCPWWTWLFAGLLSFHSARSSVQASQPCKLETCNMTVFLTAFLIYVFENASDMELVVIESFAVNQYIVCVGPKKFIYLVLEYPDLELHWYCWYVFQSENTNNSHEMLESCAEWDQLVWMRHYENLIIFKS